MNEEVKVHEDGLVRLLDIMGSDDDVVDAARISYGKGTKKVSETRNLIRYLMRHKHTSPFEMCEVKFYLKLPIFVMRQIVRHRTANLNEYSGRYSLMSEDFYVPHDDDIQKQSTQNNQGRGEDIEHKGLFKFEFNRIYDNAIHSYHNLLDLDLARELARSVLPVGNYTEVIWKIDLHNFFHFCKLRMDNHTQKETRDYAVAMYQLIKPEFPLCCEAFEDYSKDAVTFSKQEMAVIRELLEYTDTKAALAGMSVKDGPLEHRLSKREKKEFLEKI